MRVDGVQPLVDFTQAVRIFAPLGLRKKRRPLHIGCEHRLKRSRGAARRFLGDIA